MVHEDLWRFIDTTSYSFLVSYGDEERPRLEAVRDQFVIGATPTSADNDIDPLIVEEILIILEISNRKFKLMVSYADHLVGGHARERVFIDQPAYRERTRAPYWTIEKEAAEATPSSVEAAPIKVFQAFERLNAGEPSFTISQLEAIQMVLMEYHHASTCWELERAQIEQPLHRVTSCLDQRQPPLFG